MSKGQISQIIRLLVAIAGSITGWAYLDDYVWAIVPAVYAAAQSTRATILINLKKEIRQQNPKYTDKEVSRLAHERLPAWIKWLPL